MFLISKTANMNVLYYLAKIFKPNLVVTINDKQSGTSRVIELRPNAQVVDLVLLLANNTLRKDYHTNKGVSIYNMELYTPVTEDLLNLDEVETPIERYREIEQIVYSICGNVLQEYNDLFYYFKISVGLLVISLALSYRNTQN